MTKRKIRVKKVVRKSVGNSLKSKNNIRISIRGGATVPNGGSFGGGGGGASSSSSAPAIVLQSAALPPGVRDDDSVDRLLRALTRIEAGRPGSMQRDIRGNDVFVPIQPQAPGADPDAMQVDVPPVPPAPPAPLDVVPDVIAQAQPTAAPAPTPAQTPAQTFNFNAALEAPPQYRNLLMPPPRVPEQPSFQVNLNMNGIPRPQRGFMDSLTRAAANAVNPLIPVDENGRRTKRRLIENGNEGVVEQVDTPRFGLQPAPLPPPMLGNGEPRLQLGNGERRLQLGNGDLMEQNMLADL